MLNLTQHNLDRFDAVIGRIMEAGKAAGLAAAVVNKQGELVFEKYYGLRDAEKGPETFADLKEIQRMIRQLCPEVLEGWTPGAF